MEKALHYCKQNIHRIDLFSFDIDIISNRNCIRQWRIRGSTRVRSPNSNRWRASAPEPEPGEVPLETPVKQHQGKRFSIHELARIGQRAVDCAWELDAKHVHGPKASRGPVYEARKLLSEVHGPLIFFVQIRVPPPRWLDRCLFLLGFLNQGPPPRWVNMRYCLQFLNFKPCIYPRSSRWCRGGALAFRRRSSSPRRGPGPSS